VGPVAQFFLGAQGEDGGGGSHARIPEGTPHDERHFFGRFPEIMAWVGFVSKQTDHVGPASPMPTLTSSLWTGPSSRARGKLALDIGEQWVPDSTGGDRSRPSVPVRCAGIRGGVGWVTVSGFALAASLLRLTSESLGGLFRPDVSR
jgi:hypothetical protein